MVEMLLILVVFASFGLGICSHIALLWLINRRALSLINSRKNAQMQEKRITAVNDTGALMLEMKEVLGADGDFMKEKLPKLLAVCTQHPESAEMLFNRVKKFL